MGQEAHPDTSCLVFEEEPAVNPRKEAGGQELKPRSAPGPSWKILQTGDSLRIC